MLPIQNQVTNLEISQKLKELKVKQDSYFVWAEGLNFKDESGWWIRPSHSKNGDNDNNPFAISAYTSAELGEIIKTVSSETLNKLPDEFLPSQSDKDVARCIFDANYWGKMLIYLLENNLITL